MSTTSPDPAAPILVVGATGYLGSQVVDELLARGKNVRALVRPSTDATKLEAQRVPNTSWPTAEDAIRRLAEQLHANG
jgi:uncharacterized protein YbjT (DUF2867 family)